MQMLLALIEHPSFMFRQLTERTLIHKWIESYSTRPLTGVASFDFKVRRSEAQNPKAPSLPHNSTFRIMEIAPTQ